MKDSDTLNNKEVTTKEINTAVYRFSGFLNLRQLAESVFADLQETYWMIGQENLWIKVSQIQGVSKKL